LSSEGHLGLRLAPVETVTSRWESVSRWPRVRTATPYPGVYIITAVAALAPLLLGLTGWPPPLRALEVAGLMLATILSAALERQRPSTKGGATSFVIDFTALLMGGRMAATLVATFGAVLRGLAESQRRQLAVNVVTAVASTQAAGFVHSWLGGTTGHFDWPWQGLPIAAAAITYCLVRYTSIECVVPFLTQQSVNWLWLQSVARDVPDYILGAVISVLIVSAIDYQVWGLMLVATVPLIFVYRVYFRHLDRLEREQRHRDVIESLDQGMCIVDNNGRVVLWNEALQRMVECPSDRAIGRSLDAALPVLSKTEFQRAFDAAVTTRSTRTLSRFMLQTSDGVRVLQIKILPEVDGVTLLWHDLTDRSRAEQALKRSEERFALMEAGANDGLWEWEIRSEQVHFSARWRALIGLDASSGTGRLEDWLERVHPDDVNALWEAIKAHLSGKTNQLQHEHRIRHENGTYRRFLCHGVAERSARGRCARIAGSLTDVTERASAQERLRSLGFRDPLTGLFNRSVFVEGLGRRLDEFKHTRGSRFAALYLDLDRFKVVNDSLGHLIGDELLTAVSRRLESCLREGDSLARLGGDEFAILLNRLEDDGQANAIALRIQDTLSAPFSIGGREVFTSASIGIAFSASQYNNPEEIMRDADTAMYHAKARGKARHELFDAEMHAKALDRLGLENDLRHAVKSSEFDVHYQPIVSLASGMCVGFEALVRWSRNGQATSPEKFIPVAEELGLIEALGTWVLEEACRMFASWQQRYPDYGLECISVNVSTRQLMQPNFLQIVQETVRLAGLEPSNLRLEITETTLMGSPYTAAEHLRELRDFGVKVYLDDFGTGYSSLSHLHKLPVDALKIDRSFVRSLLLPERPAIVESILALARTLNTGVVAEGVESALQAQELKRLGCRHAQGYFFSPPLSSPRVERLLANRHPLGQHGDSPDHSVRTGIDPLVGSKPLEWPDEQPGGRAPAQKAQGRSSSSTSMWAH
jgi:diguanylate cyclase (GGDEF)-like protein/PAS domain S-box-containing protein